MHAGIRSSERTLFELSKLRDLARSDRERTGINPQRLTEKKMESRPVKKQNWFRAFFSLALLAVAWTPAAAADFHSGKTLRFIVGYAAGGGRG
jgi:hypothetical protein